MKNDRYELSAVRRLILKILKISLAIGIPYLIFVLLTDLRIPCLLYEATGILCPGCGLTRMFMSMARLRFFDAYSYNRAFFLLFFYWCATALFAFVGKPEFVRSRRFLSVSFIISIIILTIFCIVRNIY